jgi:hypothetical protein
MTIFYCLMTLGVMQPLYDWLTLLICPRHIASALFPTVSLGVACISVVTEMCLPSYCLTMDHLIMCSATWKWTFYFESEVVISAWQSFSEMYPGEWIGCWRLIALTLMNVFLWGHLKEHVYAVPPRAIKDLMGRLQAAVTMVDAHVCVKVHMRGCCVVHCR